MHINMAPDVLNFSPIILPSEGYRKPRQGHGYFICQIYILQEVKMAYIAISPQCFPQFYGIG